MRDIDLKEGVHYQVFFEKAIPLIFKFIKIDEAGRAICEKEDQTTFDYNMLPEFLRVKEM
jgi:hypothetical protein